TKTETIVSNASKFSNTVVVTGGEPLIWDMKPLTSLFKEKGMTVHIETSGAYQLTGQWDWICLSPKKNKLPKEDVYLKADELKMIIFNKDDFRFAEEQAERVSKDCILYLQPEWSNRDKMMPQIVDYVMNNPKWVVSLQTHKYLNIP
ncbi:MAG: organic radical activating enzyme, partial [Flavobacteriaceae bacterium]